jgi:anion transporter
MASSNNEQTESADPLSGIKPTTGLLIVCGVLVLVCAAIAALPAQGGPSPEGKRVLAIAIVAIGLWCTEVLPMALTGMLVIVLLALSGGVADLKTALVGFAQPVPYFLLGVLTIGLAVLKSGLADRIARRSLISCKGNPRILFVQLLASFPLLTLLLPSATTRSGILVHVYEQALELSGVPRRSHLSRAIMISLSSINRLASTMLLTGGITPVLSAALVGGVRWTRWFLLMSVPYFVLLAAGAGLIYGIYRSGFKASLRTGPQSVPVPITSAELRTALITLGASVLWLTDSLHHLNPSFPAVIAWICLLSPKIGVLSWREFERNVGWTNFFVLASSLSLADALIESGAGAWLAELIVGSLPWINRHPLLIAAVLVVSAAPVRLLIPSITGFLAITIPIAMSIGTLTGLNPLLCGLMVTIAGDAVLYYPAQSASSLVVYEKGYLSAQEIFRFGILMTLVAFTVVLIVAIPFWAIIGEPLK